GADVGLGEAGLLQRVAHAVLGGRRQPGPVVAPVVEVGPATDDRVAQLGQERLDLSVQLALAEVAAGAGVLDGVGVGELVGADDDVADADLPGEPPGVVQLAARDAGAVGGDGDGAVAQGEEGGLGHEGAVDAAAEGDDGAAV